MTPTPAQQQLAEETADAIYNHNVYPVRIPKVHRPTIIQCVLYALQKQAEESQADTKRLDWLESTETSVGFNVELGVWGVDFEAPYGKTVREAIDAAMQTTGEKL